VHLQIIATFDSRLAIIFIFKMKFYKRKRVFNFLILVLHFLISSIFFRNMSIFKHITILVALFCCSLSANAQFSDNFSDGNLTSNPIWQGDVANFVVTANKELQLQAPDAGSSIIYTPYILQDSMVWEALVRLEFSASTSNQLRLYLMWDSNDFANGKGYYLEFGESGNNDAIRLLRAENTNTTLATATLGAIAAEPTTVRIRMTRDAKGVWMLGADYKGGYAFQKEFSIADAKLNFKNAFFGLKCIYTATRKDKFFFDDIKVQLLAPDTQAPQLASAQVKNDNQLEVSFDEIIDSVSAININAYDVAGIGKPQTATFLSNRTGALLTFKSAFAANTYTLNIKNIKDEIGNNNQNQSITFSYFSTKEAQAFDVIINEIMVDPTPVVTLPNAEFIELYNRKDFAINLLGYSLMNNSGTTVALPDISIGANEYLILNIKEDFSKYGKSLAFAKFIGLGNDADVVSLFNNKGVLMDRVEYKLSTYRDTKKKDGGWSLERIDADYPCLGEENWQASLDLSGGTPGRKNSVQKTTNDKNGPILLQVFAISDKEIVLTFDRYVQKTANLSINGITIQSVVVAQDNPRNATVYLSTPLLKGKEYSISYIANTFNDCTGLGNTKIGSVKVALTESPKPKDIVINEVLIDGVKFIELYNRSAKAINVADLKIASLDNGADIKEIKKSYLLLPDQYVVLTENASLLKLQFEIQNLGAVIETDLPTLTIDSSNITLLSKDSIKAIVIDVFDYKASLHNPLLKSTKGISLERIFQDDPTQDKHNWQSASSVVRATPTYKNSQFHQPNTGSGTEPFSIEVARLSPDNDGYEDYLTVNYKLDNAGYKANARIYDSEGRLVKNWIDGETLSAEGSLIWAGDRDDAQVARTGIYLIWVQYFHADGTVRIQKLPCAVIN
jgi:hypothetical protein